MSRRNIRSAVPPRPTPPTSSNRPRSAEPPSGPVWWGDWLRRIALGLTAGLVTARAYWPAEPEGLDAGSGLDWAFALLVLMGLALASALIGGTLRLRWAW